MFKRLILIFSITVYPIIISTAAVIHVPADFPSIQAAINSSSDGDTVMVAPGNYAGGANRNLSTGGRAITVTSSGGPLVTFIDGNVTEKGFEINGGEDSTTIIEGFTVYNSYCGIYCDSSAPYLRNMIVKDFLNYGIHFDGFLADPPITPVIENCLVFQEEAVYIGTGNGFHGARSIDVTITGCVFENLTYGLEFHTYDDKPPDYNIRNTIIRNNIVDGIWAHS